MKLGIIVGSVRDGRLGERIKLWAERRAAAHEGIEVITLDLQEYPLPFYAENREPSKIEAGTYADPTANAWYDAVSGVDAFVFLTPEYNHGYPAQLKNALDYLYQPWQNKPALLVSYSTGPIGGARVVEQLRPVLNYMGLTVLPIAIHLGKAQESFSEDGMVISGPFDEMLDKQLAELIRWNSLLP